jgi:hypothetical protein
LNKIGSIAENNFEERKKSEKKDCETQLRVMFNYILQNYKKMDGELVETYSKIINTLYNSNKYSSDIDNEDIIPFEFDKRNGFYRAFCKDEYTPLVKCLEFRKELIEYPENFCTPCLERKTSCTCIIIDDESQTDSEVSASGSESELTESIHSDSDADPEPVPGSCNINHTHTPGCFGLPEPIPPPIPPPVPSPSPPRSPIPSPSSTKLDDIIAFFKNKSVETIEKLFSKLEEETIEIIYKKLDDFIE